MNLRSANESNKRFEAFAADLANVLGRKGRGEQFVDYSRGLIVAPGRKSVEPIATATAPAKVAAKHQSLLHFVGQSEWSDSNVLNKVREKVQPLIERHGSIEASIIDDTAHPKKGKHSVGVAHQYCGQLGKQANCQNAVSLSIANHHASLPIGYRLYLPQEWTKDRERRKAAGVPPEIRFKTKPQIAIDLIQQAIAQGVSMGVTLADAAYGNNTTFRDDLTALGLTYAVGIGPTTTVWAPGTEPLPPKKWRGRGRRPTHLRRNSRHKPISVKKLAMRLPEDAWQKITWREGTNKDLTSRFARVRVRPAHEDTKRSEPRPEEWLLVEWPEGEKEPTKYGLSTLSEDTPFETMVDIAKLRWRVERDYEELKQEVGLGHYEGRSWRGFHHHATLCIAAYGFLVAERAVFPPLEFDVSTGTFKKFALPKNYRPRGSPASYTAPR